MICLRSHSCGSNPGILAPESLYLILHYNSAQIPLNKNYPIGNSKSCIFIHLSMYLPIHRSIIDPSIHLLSVYRAVSLKYRNWHKSRTEVTTCSRCRCFPAPSPWLTQQVPVPSLNTQFLPRLRAYTGGLWKSLTLRGKGPRTWS